MESPLLQDLEAFTSQGNYIEVLQFLTHFRKKFTKQQSFPFPLQFKASLMTFLQKFIVHTISDLPERSKLKMESLWLITNITATLADSEFLQLITNDLIKDILHCLESNYFEILENALWALANISGCHVIFRDQIIASRLFLCVNKIKSKLFLLQHLELPNPKSKPKRTSLLNPVAWLFCNLFIGPPYPDFPMIKHYIGTLIELLYEGDPEIIKYTLRAWRGITQKCGENEIKILNNFGLMMKILGVLVQNIEIEEKKHKDVVYEGLKVVGNIVAESSNAQTQIYFDCNLVKVLEMVLRKNEKDLVGSVCWILSNLAMGNDTQIKVLMQNEIYEKMIRNLKSKDSHIQSESLHFFTNLVAFSTMKQRNILVNKGILCSFFNSLELFSQQEEKILMALRSIHSLLETCPLEKVGVQSSWRFALQKMMMNYKGKTEISDICDGIQNFFEESDLKLLGSYFNINFYPFQED